MPFDTRCPVCSTKLRLDDAPRPGEQVECPKCGDLFAPRTAAPKAAAAKPAQATAAAAKPAPRRPRDEDDEEDAPARKPPKAKKGGGTKGPKSIIEEKTANPNNKGIKRKAKKKVTNPVFLLAAIGFGFVILAAVFAAMIYFLGKAGNVQEMLTFVPSNVNWVRGVNVSQLAKYPGYSAETDKFYTPDIKAAVEHVAKAAGNDTTTALDYLLIAKQRDSATAIGTMYVLRMAGRMKAEALAAGLGATSSPVNGEQAYRFGASAPGILANAVMVVPTDRVAVVVPPGGMQSTLASGSTAGKGGKGDSFATKLGDAGRKTISGSIWLLIRNTGYFKTYLGDSMAVVSGDFSKLVKAAEASPIFGVWTSPGGGGVRVGAAIECADAEAAKGLAKSMTDGPLGKGDESEPPNELKKSGLQFISNKRVFGEFAQNLTFGRFGSCGFVVSTLNSENAKSALGTFNSPTMGMQ
jgi:hypothetical protein